MSEHLSEKNEPLSKKDRISGIFDNISTIINDNPFWAITSALSLIIIGILIDYGFVDYTFEKHSSYNIIVKVVSRLLISLGEATFVFLLLQITIESKMSEKHIEVATTTFENLKKELALSQKSTLKAITDKSFNDFLQKSLPESFTERLLGDGFFGFDVLRTNTEWFYKIKKEPDGNILLIQEITYTVSNLLNEPTKHDITLETFNTYESKTKILKVCIGSESNKHVFTGEQLNKSLDVKSEGQKFSEQLILKPRESVRIEQIVENIYTDKKITDFHAPTEHTMNLQIKVQFLSDMNGIDFNLNVPFLKKKKDEQEAKTSELGYEMSGFDTTLNCILPQKRLE